MKHPCVSCIMPTADRPLMVPFAIDYFLNQSFRDAELIVVDDGKSPVRSLIPDHHRIRYFYTKRMASLGEKRNYACSRAGGELIVHWDDDDYYGQDWIKKEVEAIENSDADICGLNEVIFFSPLRNKYWKVCNKNDKEPWIAGATMIYRHSFWKKHPFRHLQIGEDNDFIWSSKAKTFAHSYTDGFISILHAGNTTLKPFENPGDKKNASLWMDVTPNETLPGHENSEKKLKF